MSNTYKKNKTKLSGLIITAIALVVLIVLAAGTFGVGYYMNGNLDIANWWKNPANSDTATPETPAAPFVVGETCEAVYFDMSCTPDLTKLTYDENGLCTLLSGAVIGGDEPYTVGIQAVDFGAFTNISSYDGIYLIIKAGTTGAYYSSASFVSSLGTFENVSQGWQNLNEDGSATVFEHFVVEKSVYVPYISGTSFVAEDPVDEVTATPFILGARCTDVFFDTSSTPDLSNLDYVNGRYYFLFGNFNDPQYSQPAAVVALDLYAVTGLSDLEGIYALSTLSMSRVYYVSAETPNFAGDYNQFADCEQGWNGAYFNEDGSAQISEFVVEYAVDVPFISSTPFTTAVPGTNEPGDEEFVVTDPIEVGDELTELYFNTSLSEAEVDALLAQLDWENPDADEGAELGGEYKYFSFCDMFQIAKFNVEMDGLLYQGYGIADSGLPIYASNADVATIFGGSVSGWSVENIASLLNNRLPRTVTEVVADQNIWGQLISKNAF